MSSRINIDFEVSGTSLTGIRKAAIANVAQFLSLTEDEVEDHIEAGAISLQLNASPSTVTLSGQIKHWEVKAYATYVYR